MSFIHFTSPLRVTCARCICPCFQHWITSPLWVTCSRCICPCFQHWITSPLWVACSVVSVHAFSTGSQVLYGSLVLLSGPTQVLCGLLVSVWVACSLIRSHTSPLWVTCFGVGRLFSYQVPHRSSVGHLFRCGSSVLLSGPTQVLCGSLVSVWVVCSLIKSHTSPLWVACFGVGRLFSYLCVRVCVCVCVCACV
jgi:hypothetical protein